MPSYIEDICIFHRTNSTISVYSYLYICYVYCNISLYPAPINNSNDTNHDKIHFLVYLRAYSTPQSVVMK
jgi:hypothetical protein